LCSRSNPVSVAAAERNGLSAGMGDHEDQHERQEGDYEWRVQLVELGQLGILPVEADVAAGVGWTGRPRLIRDTPLRADRRAFTRATDDPWRERLLRQKPTNRETKRAG
jgi:hypothetical protein